MTTSSPEAYDDWYRTQRGAWIGDREVQLIARHLRLGSAETVLDVGCGTGFFTRRFASGHRGSVVGVDPDPAAIGYARDHTAASERYVVGRAESLPFPARSFDVTISVTSLCFIQDQQSAVREIARVTRRRFAVGLLNRHSALWSTKGRGGGTGGYRGAHWHTRREATELVQGVAQRAWTRTAVQLPSASRFARLLERLLPSRWPWGGFLLVVGEIPPVAQS